MELLLEFVKIVLPAGLVLYGVFLTVKAFLNKEFETKLINIKTKNTETVLPIRLQAYERVCLLLERVSPHNLILRVNNPAYTSSQLQQIMVNEIREELNHNLSQQVYMSDQAWGLSKSAIEEIIGLVNSAAEEVDPNSRGVELAKRLFDKLMQKNEDPCLVALKFVKNEIRQSF
jgi:hypothetical protein